VGGAPGERRKYMKITTIVTIGIALACGYFMGIIHTETPVYAQTMTETQETIPDGYIPLDECIPLEDISCFFIDGYDYPCFELKDIANQLDDENNRSYRDIMESLTDETEDFINNFVNMRQVVDFSNTENGLQLYMSDGSGYYWER
jgi:hypothetical protein